MTNGKVQNKPKHFRQLAAIAALCPLKAGRFECQLARALVRTRAFRVMGSAAWPSLQRNPIQEWPDPSGVISSNIRPSQSMKVEGT
jgi:hypothetical protein